MSVVYQVRHRTYYDYKVRVSDSYTHARLQPCARDDQRVSDYRLALTPKCPSREFRDYFGNHVAVFNMAAGHRKLAILSSFTVEKRAEEVPHQVLETTVAEARQILGRHYRVRYFDYVHPTRLVPVGAAFRKYVRKFLPDSAPLGEGLLKLNTHIHEAFTYMAGKTNVETTAEQTARRKKGVCQDFAHFLLGVLRSAQMPARYVSGYIETSGAKEASESGRPELIGSAATHAWVEVLLPGGYWLGLDPTNDITTGNRHIVVSTGRDFSDVTPVKGVYRGSVHPEPEVSVIVHRQVSGPHRAGKRS